MGASFLTFVVETNDRSQVIKRFNQEVNNVDRPGPYSGDWDQARGLTFPHHAPFSSYQEAENWLDTHCQKWEDAKAVQFKVADKTPKILKIESELAEVSKKIRLFDDVSVFKNSVLARVKSGKVAFKTVDCCRSRLAVAYLKSVDCPVCFTQNSLLSKVDRKRLHNLLAKGEKLERSRKDLLQRLEGAKQDAAQKPGARINWMVGCLASS